MKEFARAANGYDPVEVNKFLDQVIDHIERMINDIKFKDEIIRNLEADNKEVEILKEKLEHYKNIEQTLNSAVMMAQRTSEQIKSNAYRESELILEDAKRNANRIVNEALLKAEKIEMESAMLKRNVNLFKRKLRGIIEDQLALVDDIEKVDF